MRYVPVDKQRLGVTVLGAVLYEHGSKLQVREDLELIGNLASGEVRVRVRASGICHSDVSAVDGVIPGQMPMILGHETAGEVLEVGGGVSGLGEGDRVVLSLVPPCGHCRRCLTGQANLCQTWDPFAQPPRHRAGGTDIFRLGGVGSWVEEVVVPAECAIPIDGDVPFETACLLGCAVTTGVGAALNTAKVTPGSSVAVYGCGGVGMSVIQGARIAGAAAIMAIDLRRDKLDIASTMGATHLATPSEVTSVGDLIHGGDGFDYVFEVVGRSQTIRDAFDSSRRGGTVTVVGAGAMDDMVAFSAFDLYYYERKLLGCVYGSADVRVEFPRLLQLWRAGLLDLESLVTRTLPLEVVNDGLQALREGEQLRQVILFA